MMDIIKAMATKNRCYKIGQKMTPRGIVVHSTGCNNPNLKRYVDCSSECGANINNNHWNNYQPDGQDKCVHAFIGYDKDKKVRVAQILPYTMACWGVGGGPKGSYNYDPVGHIQFEMCEDGLTDKTYFNKIWDVAVEYCGYLCKEYNLDPMGKNVIVGHYEAAQQGYGSSHGDPKNWFSKHGKTMDDFRKAVKAAMGGSATTSAATKTIYCVQVGAFSSKTSAQGVVAQLKAKGYAAIIKETTVGGKKLYTVQVGAFGNRANADAMAQQLKAKGYAAIIKAN